MNNKNFRKKENPSFSKLFLYFSLTVFVAYLALTSLNFESVKASGHTDDVVITATVEAWATLSLDPSGAISFDQVLVDEFGATNIGNATTTLTMGTNHGDGLTVAIKSDNAELVGPGDNITSATSTVVAGADHYGVQCTNATGGASCGFGFDLAGENVKGLTVVDQDFATATVGTDREAVLAIKAASVNTRQAGSYTDTITLTATPGL